MAIINSPKESQKNMMIMRREIETMNTKQKL